MAKLTEFLKQTGEFLKADIVKQQPKGVIFGKSEIVHNEKYDTDRLHIPLKIADKEYTFDCSKTNARTIASVLGEDSDAWLNAELEFEVYKTKTSEGKMTEAINVKAVTKN